ncbi:hypothetical protein LEP1GSC116_4722 [Leptospira interrogans serovar Icterohaemorrhagiae str. Verdun HP]|uniref:Uncharacterized protein n=2 Tax=Leptospira interrogans TaxID=173 RepID=M6R9L3_LEPIR|nr:conserved hypothetical protein [Leptospira interrogans serovar Copenhageni str. Fiocruz L1-130]EMO04822.1 hypothetical protein LEP1GSC116_4722 [Leptospira interrogans serovar Icterohaemorrhagiae str. Verdun HP]
MTFRFLSLDICKIWELLPIYIYSGIYIFERKIYTRTLSILFLYSFRSKNIRILSCFSKSSA